jgi:hypothetical protein
VIGALVENAGMVSSDHCLVSVHRLKKPHIESHKDHESPEGIPSEST